MSQIFCENIQPPLWDDLPCIPLKGTTDLYRISIRDHASLRASLLRFLSNEELLRANKYHQQKDKVRFEIGKGMLRMILAQYMDCSPQEISFSKGFNNKPYIIHPKPLGFNISYSNNWIIIAISSGAVGVDIEYINENFDYPMIMDSCFMEKEIDSITSSRQSRDIFFQSWTRKEALLKATALGLGDYLKDFSCLDGIQPIPQHIVMDNHWRIISFLMDDSYYVSIAQNKQQPIKYCGHSYFPVLTTVH